MAASVYRGVRYNSIYAVVISVFVHALVILVFFEITPKESRSNSYAIQMIRLKPQNAESVLIIEAPAVNFKSGVISPIIPDIAFAENVDIDLGLIQSASDIPNQLSYPGNEKYPNVFDPKVRQKLLDAQRLNKPRTPEKSKSWTEADGRTFVDMGNGNCLVSMPKVDSRDRGTNWGHTRCGKTDSENAMDRVMADFESRKPQH